MDSPSTPRRSARIQRLSSQTSTLIADETSTRPTSSSSSTQPLHSSPLSSSTKNTMSNHIRSPLSPYLPTHLETVLLAIYPMTLLFGSLYSLLDSTTRNSPYNDITQSHYANTAPSYFAKKSNVFNIFFVKRGWAWVTFAYFFFLLTHPANGVPYSFEATKRRLRGVARWSVVTLWWVFVTQWFFGPAIIDRGFVLTGGKCDLVEAVQQGKTDTVMSKEEVLITGLACKAVGGKWKGGHDISGHVFLLVLGSLFLLLEVLHVTLKFSHRDEGRVVTLSDGAVKSAEVETDRVADSKAEVRGQWTLGAKFALGVAALSVYMLLMTAAYFHTWFEKFTGLLTALSAIFVVYFLPRGMPAVRQFIGMPGI